MFTLTHSSLADFLCGIFPIRWKIIRLQQVSKIDSQSHPAHYPLNAFRDQKVNGTSHHKFYVTWKSTILLITKSMHFDKRGPQQTNIFYNSSLSQVTLIPRRNTAHCTWYSQGFWWSIALSFFKQTPFLFPIPTIFDYKVPDQLTPVCRCQWIQLWFYRKWITLHYFFH